MSRKVVELIEENLRLRALLIAASSVGEKESTELQQSEDSGEEQQSPHSVEEGTVLEVEMEGSEDPLTLADGEAEITTKISTDGGSGREEREGECVGEKSRGSSQGADEMAISEGQDRDGGSSEESRSEGDSSRESRDVEEGDRGSIIIDTGNERELSDSKQGGEAGSSSLEGNSGSREGDADGGGTEEIGSGAAEREKEGRQGHRGKEVVGIYGSETGGNTAAEQPWPISSLLSGHSRSVGPSRDILQQTFSLPILSPTYIAEHCSTTTAAAASDLLFFNPQTPLPMPTTSSGSVARAVQADQTHNASLYAPLTANSSTSKTTASVAVSFIHTGLSRATPLVCSSLAAATATVSGARPLPHSHHISSRLSSSSPRHPSIVQPWVGQSHPTNQHSSSTVPRTSCADGATTASGLPGHHDQPPPGASPYGEASLSAGFRIINPRQSRHAPTHSSLVQSRNRPNKRGQMCLPQYREQLQHNVDTDAALLGTYPPGHTTNSAQTRHHLCSYSSARNATLCSSTAPIFPVYASGSMNQSNPPPAPPLFEPLYQHPSHHHPQATPHSLHPQQHRVSHTSCVHPSSLHHHHQLHTHHQQAAHSLRPPHPPHFHPHPPPPPPFTPHHLTPSHHHTTTGVWRPYSDRQRTSTRFNLSDILSPSPASPVTAPPVIHQHSSPGGRIPSFFVDHLLDDL